MSDGLCYHGYLWDCFKEVKLAKKSFCMNYLNSKKEIIIFWDINSQDYIYKKDYWKYGKDTMLILSIEEFIEKQNTFPEDIYIFNETLIWTIVFTHETTSSGKPFCIFIEGGK